jgi:hypothetical protein
MIEGKLVGLLTIQQKDKLLGVEYIPDVYYNPVQDGNGDWIISMEEIDNTTDYEFLWVQELPLIQFIPIPSPISGATL